MSEEYGLFNKMQIDISEYEEENVDELEKKRMMKRFSKSSKKKTRISDRKIVAAAVAILMVANLAIRGDNALADVESFKYNISNWLGKENIKNNYSAEIGETIKEKGIKVTLNEFFTDNDRIIINLEIKRKAQPVTGDEYKNFIPDLYVNGRKVDIDTSYVGYSLHFIGKGKGKEAADTSVILETQTKGLNLVKKENIKLVFTTLAKRYGIAKEKLSYDFSYDINNYMKDCKVVVVNKKITEDENNLQVDKVIVSPDRIRILGNQNGFTQHGIYGNINYHYDVVDQNNELVPLKADIGEGAFFYKGKSETTSLKIIPYTYKEINTNCTKKDDQGRVMYAIEDQIITINLK